MANQISRKHRVLIVNAYFDPWREATPTRLFVPRPMAPYFLAGHFDQAHCDVRVWDEVFNGALLKRSLFDWPDMVVFTGLTAAFDRAHQLTAYFRNGNPDVVTVIGGHIARALPALCATIFDYVCQGDTDDIVGVIEEAFGPSAALRDAPPRHDLTAPNLGVGYVETTKYCNFACSFCTLTGEGRPYVPYTDADINRQLDAVGRVHGLLLSDNNFFGNNRRSFETRARLLGDRVRRGQFSGWGCLVTGDFFANPANLKLVAENGCKAIFSGVETLDPKVLGSYNKKQSLISHPLALAEACAEHGILFDYGMMVDFSQQTMAEVAEQVQGILDTPRMKLPAFVSTTIPIVGTPYFDDAIEHKRIMPGVLLSDMDGVKLVEWPKEPVDEVAAFYGDLVNMRRRQIPLIRHAVRHAWQWRKELPLDLTALSLLMPLQRYRRRRGVGSLAQMAMSLREARPTYNAQTDRPRLAYTPMFRLPERFASNFEPLQITDESGAMTDQFERARERPVAVNA